MIEDLLQGPHLVILLLLVALLFGGKRLPDAARGIGQSLRVFKMEMKARPSDDEAGDAPRAVAAVPDAATPSVSVQDGGEEPTLSTREARER